MSPVARSIRIRFGAKSNALLASIALLSVVVSTAYAATLPNSNVVQLPLTPTQKYWGWSSGSNIVWSERDGLHGYNLTTKTAFTIPTLDRVEGKPRIDGNRVLWNENLGDKSTGLDIVGYDLATKQHFDVTRGKGYEGNFEIDGDLVVWVDPDESSQSNIYAKNLSTNETFTVTDAPGCQGTPDVAGDWVVYTDYSAPGGDDIKAFNVRTKERKTLCDWKGNQYYPRVSKTGLVVWQDSSAGNMDIRGRYIQGGDIRTIASGVGSQNSPSVGGDLVCYHDSRRPGGYGMLGYDLLSGTRFGVASVQGDYVVDTKLNDGTVVWFASAYEGPYANQTRVYVARPTELEVIPETAVDLAVDESQDDFRDGAETVVLATSATWKDAGVGAAVAGTKSPLLITSGSKLSASVSKELKRLKPSSVVLIGSASSISATAAAQVASALPSATIERFAGSGATATSLVAAEKVAERSTWNGTVFITSRDRYTSAVMVAPVAARKGYPIVYVGSEGLSSVNTSAFAEMGAKQFVIVGPDVPSSVDSRLKAKFGLASVRRITGSSSSETSARFASWAVASAGMRWNHMGVASNSNWTRGIAEATAKGHDGGVILLTNDTALSSPASDALKAHEGSIRDADFIGDSGIVSKDVRRQVRLIVR